MSDIVRIATSRRWSDVVIHAGVAYWVEVADDPAQDVRGQLKQVFAQIDSTLERHGGGRDRLLQVLIYLSDLKDAAALNELWDSWVSEGNAPVRACVQAGLASPYRVEMVITAAIPGDAT